MTETAQTGVVGDAAGVAGVMPAPAAAAAPGEAVKRPTYDADSILAAAVAVFNRHGYDGTSMGMLAHELGISKAGIYYHVPSKEDLLARACDRALSALEAAVADVAAGPGTALDRLEAAVRRAVQVLADELPYVTLLLRVRGNTAGERAAVERRRDFDHRFALLVEAARDEGSLRSDVDARTITRFIYGTINSLIEWYRPDGDLGVDELGDALVSLLFDGLARR